MVNSGNRVITGKFGEARRKEPETGHLFAGFFHRCCSGTSRPPPDDKNLFCNIRLVIAEQKAKGLQGLNPVEDHFDNRR